mgnify:CR=1 FL=1
MLFRLTLNWTIKYVFNGSNGLIVRFNSTSIWTLEDNSNLGSVWIAAKLVWFIQFGTTIKMGCQLIWDEFKSFHGLFVVSLSIGKQLPSNNHHNHVMCLSAVRFYLIDSPSISYSYIHSCPVVWLKLKRPAYGKLLATVDLIEKILLIVEGGTYSFHTTKMSNMFMPLPISMQPKTLA